MDAVQRRGLRAAIEKRYPWVAGGDLGPAAVEAGECDVCGAEARLITTCGPGAYRYLGRRCTATLGDQAWCDGHADEARDAAAWVAALPPEADVVARLWWVATGEIGVDPRLQRQWRDQLRLPGL